jgi:hypothetical protein
MRFRQLWSMCVLCVFSLSAYSHGSEQTPAPSLAQVTEELSDTRAALAQAQQQILDLRRDLDELRRQVKSSGTSASDNEAPTTAAADQDPAFLAAKISELHQDKVESSSRYPVKISGLILFNSYVNSGSVYAADVPVLAFPRAAGSPNGSIGATLSQTILGLEVKGPDLFGAKTSGDVAVDFAGGSPTTQYGATAGLVRLRTADTHFYWSNTSLTVGQDTPFFSPLSPTSYATVQQPGLSWAGNLWVWTPQAVLQHKVTTGDASGFVLQGGLLDPLSEEIPSFQGRSPSAGELTRVPALAGRIAYEDHSSTNAFTFGFAGYHARQKYDSVTSVDSWTINTDFQAKLSRFVELSGEGYKGQAVGGLGGGIWSSVIFPEPSPPHSALRPLRSLGGWAQLKLKPLPVFEINIAMGQDENYARDLRTFLFPFATDGFPAFQKNQAQFVNFIYTPRSVLIFALEYRHLRSTLAGSQSASGDQVNVAAGVHF